MKQRDGTSSSDNTPRKGRRWLRLAGWFVLVVVAGAVAGRTFIQDGVDSVVRRKVEERLAKIFPELDVRVAGAHLIRKKGIELRGVTLTLARNAAEADEPPVVAVDRVWISCSTAWRDLISGNLPLFEIELERPALCAVRDANGEWNLAALLATAPLPSNQETFPRIQVRDGRIDVADALRPGRPLELRGLSGQLAPAPDGWKLEGQVNADRFGRIQVEGHGELATSKWTLSGSLTEIEFSPQSCRLLPHNLLTGVAPLEQVTARGELAFELQGQGLQTPRFSVHGRVFDARVTDPRLPYPLDGLEAQVRVTNERFELHGVKARMGRSRLSANVVVDQWTSDPRLDLQAGIVELGLDERVRAAATVHPSLERLWKRFAPSGLIDVAVRASASSDQPLSLKADITCRNVTVRYEKFPYAVDSVQGLIRFDRGAWRTENLTARVGNQMLQIDSAGQAYPGGWTGEVNLSTSGFVPIDARLVDAFPDGARQFIQSLSATGTLRLHRAIFRREKPYQETESDITVEFRDGSLNYAKFPYPLTRVRGWLMSHNRQWEVREAEGHHGMTRVRWDATWRREANAARGIDLEFRLRASDVLLDPDLLQAVRRSAPHAARAWEGLRPEGALDDVTVTLGFRTSQGIERLDVHATKNVPSTGVVRRAISVEPQWLPYRWESVTGDFRFVDGRVELRNVAGRHGSVSFRLGGTCRFDRYGRWQVHLNRISLDQVVLDPPFLRALPPTLARTLETLRIDGTLGLDGTMSLQGQPSGEPDADWNVRVEMAGGNIRSGPGLMQLHGGIQLVGRRRATETVCTGELDVDSVFVRGIQVTQVRGPIHFDAERLRLGVWAEAARPGHAPRSVTGKLLRGNMGLDGQVLFRPDHPYDVQLAVSDAELSALIQQLTGRPAGNTAGRFSGTVRIAGDESAVHDRRGQGSVRIRDARMYELPVMVALLSVLRLKTPDRTAFHRVDLDFRIKGDHLQFDRIDLTGNAVTLRGRGWANLQQQIHFNFYTVVGRDELVLPLLRTVLAEASRQILEIEVVGTLGQPQVQRTAFPELDATLQRLFPELTQQTSAPRR